MRGRWERGEGGLSVSLLVFLSSSPSLQLFPHLASFFFPPPQLSPRYGTKNTRIESELGNVFWLKEESGGRGRGAEGRKRGGGQW